MLTHGRILVSFLWLAVYLLAADNCFSPKTRYNAPVTPLYTGAILTNGVSFLQTTQGV